MGGVFRDACGEDHPVDQVSPLMRPAKSETGWEANDKRYGCRQSRIVCPGGESGETFLFYWSGWRLLTPGWMLYVSYCLAGHPLAVRQQNQSREQVWLTSPALIVPYIAFNGVP